MDSARLTAVSSLTALADSSDVETRADAGRALAVFADVPQAGAPLIALVLDAHDTFVTLVTTEALLRRQDAIGCALVARAFAVADDNHADWISVAVSRAFGVYGRDRDAALRLCRTLLDDGDEEVRAGARMLITELSALVPVLIATEDARRDAAAPG